MSLKKRPPKSSRPYMPGYGLPEHNRGLLLWSWANQRLSKSHNYWIATVRPDGWPHVMIVWGIWLDYVFYFSTGRQSRKARNLAANPKCAVCTERAHEAVIFEGVARVVREKPLRQRFFRVYERKYHWDMSSYQQEPVYAVRPVTVFGLDEKASLNRATRWRFPRS